MFIDDSLGNERVSDTLSLKNKEDVNESNKFDNGSEATNQNSENIKKKSSSSLLKLKTLVVNFPRTSGVYRMYDQDEKVIYIGKAKDLRGRVSSYLNKRQDRLITEILMTKVVHIDYIVTDTEKDALVLENTLIKKHLPFFNIDLKDDKSYPYLQIINEKYPRLIKTRQPEKGGEVFGPYTDVKLLNVYLDIVNSLYPLKKCRQTRFPKGFRPCLYFHIGKCLDYCTGGVAPETVKMMKKGIRDLITGGRLEVIKKLMEKLDEEKNRLNYERAREIKHYIDVLSTFDFRQKLNTSEKKDFDVINYAQGNGVLVIAVLSFRDGRLVDKFTYEFENKLYEEDTGMDWLIEEVWPQFLFEYYSRIRESVSQIIIPFLFTKTWKEKEIVTEFERVVAEAITLAAKRIKKEDSTFTMVLPKVKTGFRGERVKYLNLAQANASYSLQLLMKRQEQKSYAKRLRTFLKLPKIPRVVESFDIANTADRRIIAGMVRFVDGEKDKNNYRIFNIKSTDTQNDFKSMEEAVYRRYRRLLEENRGLPDLIMIDGGKGQLSAARKSLESLGLKGRPIISLAKEKEEIYVPKLPYPLKMSHDDPGLRFLVMVRDETHRFVNSTHVRLRDRQEMKSLLSEVKGLGEKKIKILLTRFDSWESIKLSDPEAIEQLPFFSKKDTELLIEFLKHHSC